MPSHLNGPSGIILDELYLKPLNLTRADVWFMWFITIRSIEYWQAQKYQKNYVP